MSMSGQRSHDRVFLDRAIAVQLSSGKIIQARLVNLSAGGLGILYPAPAEPGSTLGLHFQLPDNNNETVTIHCKGIVRHTHVHHEYFLSGFEFKDISEQDRAVIIQFMNRKRATMNQRMVVR